MKCDQENNWVLLNCHNVLVPNFLWYDCVIFFRSWFRCRPVMAEEPAAEVRLLRGQKAKLIEILSADADFVLQHVDSCCLIKATSRWKLAVFLARRWPSCSITSSREGLMQHMACWNCWRTRPCRKPSPCFALWRICKSTRCHQVEQSLLRMFLLWKGVRLTC